MTRDIDPAVARTIGRCIELDPRDRPASASAVAASLPGGNPLAEALAAGVTPSPQVVASSGEGAVISARAALLNLVFVIVGLAAVVGGGSRVSILELIPSGNPPEVLAQKARELIAAFGYTSAAIDRASGFLYGKGAVDLLGEGSRCRSSSHNSRRESLRSLSFGIGRVQITSCRRAQLQLWTHVDISRRELIEHAVAGAEFATIEWRRGWDSSGLRATRFGAISSQRRSHLAIARVRSSASGGGWRREWDSNPR